MSGPLDGVRILDFTQELAGPWATAILSDMGAEVFKIERISGGDPARGAAMRRATELPVSPYFFGMNRGKYGMALDLKQPEAKEIIYKLAATCDVVVNNWRVEVLNRLGFGYERLKEIKPDIIYLNQSAFGPKGPWKDKPGRDPIGQHAGGLTHLNGMPGDPPLPAPAVVSDSTSALWLAAATLAALYHRERTGKGQQVFCSLYGSTIALQPWEINEWSLAGRKGLGRTWRKAGRDHPYALRGAWGAFKTADGYIAIAGIMGRDRWERACEIFGLDPDDARFSTPQAMAQNGDEFQKLLDTITPNKTCDEWLELLEAADILSTKVQTYEEIINNEQALVNNYIVTVDHPEMGPCKVVGVPISMTDCEIKPRGLPPEHGQHNEEVMLTLGYTWEQIEELRNKAVIGPIIED